MGRSAGPESPMSNAVAERRSFRMHLMRMPTLPSGVWTHVASFLSVKDAARLSGQKAGQVLALAGSCC